jgi:AraC-like DNA-binding protein
MTRRAITRHSAVAHATCAAGLSAMSLASDRAFPRHAHDQYGIGVIEHGAHRSWSGRGQVEARAGEVITVNPGEVHDGAPLAGTSRRWRMLYLDPRLVSAAWDGGPAEFARPAAAAPRTAACFAHAFAMATTPAAESLAVEEAVARLLVVALSELGDAGPRRAGPPPPIARARARLDEAPAETVTLAALAALSGVTVPQLLRGFSRTLGMTPHAYLMQRRVRFAQAEIARGVPLAEAAASAGFADQSHMTRAFTRQLGLPPGRFRAALRG